MRTRSSYSACVIVWPSFSLPTGNRFSTLKLATRSVFAAGVGTAGGYAALIGPRSIVGAVAPASCGTTLK